MTADPIITLIGMPGSGKSTVSAVLAEQLGLEVVDADGLIEAQENQTLQQIMDGQRQCRIPGHRGAGAHRHAPFLIGDLDRRLGSL